ncbi:MAG: penicillin-binding protein 2 [Armatimonadota bacterium]
MSGFDLRLKVFALLVSALMALLTVRLWVLQLTQWVDYTGQALANRTSVVSTPAPRGIIFDREGRMLAENRPSWDVEITPAKLPEEPDERAKLITRLASLLRDRGVSTAQVRKAIEGICRQASVRPMRLGEFADGLPLEIVAQIEEQRLDLPGVSVREGFKRHYPHGELASHVLGYARPITSEQYKLWRDLQYPTPGRQTSTARERGIEPWRDDPVYGPDSIFGQDGIEAACELDTSVKPPVPMLQGRRGMRVWEVDVHNRPLRLIREERVPEQGADVYLTIDCDLQRTAEEALARAVGAKRTGAVVLLDVNTGEVLAMASLPAVDPNRWVRGFSEQEYQRLLNDSRHPFYNKAIAGTYPPGSIFKIISAPAALASGADPEHRYTCAGRIGVGRPVHWFNCWKNHGGALNMWEGLAQSCDVYFYELVRKGGLSSDTIAQYARLFGLGQPTGVGLPSEAAGLVPDREWKADARDEDWYTGDTLQYVIGQSFLKVTPLQMAVATAAIANGGTLIRPQLVRKIRWPDYLQRPITLFEPQIVRRLPIDPADVKVVQQGMRRAITDRNGTAHHLDASGLCLAGKTGSAQHYLDKPTHAWFVCYGPFDQPRFACAVLVTEGGHGSEAAAPVALAVMSAALGKYQGGGPEDLQALLSQAQEAAAHAQGD